MLRELRLLAGRRRWLAGLAATVGVVLAVAGVAAASNNQGQNKNGQGQNGRPSCTVTVTSGCLTLTNAVMSGDGVTVTVNGVWSFATTCNDVDPVPANRCSAFPVPNNLATGSGTYVIKDGTGGVVERGTITTADTPGSVEGLLEGLYESPGGPSSCSAASLVRVLQVVGSTGNPADPVVRIVVEFDPTNAFGDGSKMRFLASAHVLDSPGTTGATINC
jgi:hypothetical protein